MLTAVDWSAVEGVATTAMVAVALGGAAASYWRLRRGGKESLTKLVLRIARVLFGVPKDDQSNAPEELGFVEEVRCHIKEMGQFQRRTEQFMDSVQRELSVNGKPENTVKGAVVKLCRDDIPALRRDVTALQGQVQRLEEPR